MSGDKRSLLCKDDLDYAANHPRGSGGRFHLGKPVSAPGHVSCMKASVNSIGMMIQKFEL